MFVLKTIPMREVAGCRTFRTSGDLADLPFVPHEFSCLPKSSFSLHGSVDLLSLLECRAFSGDTPK